MPYIDMIQSQVYMCPPVPNAPPTSHPTSSLRIIPVHHWRLIALKYCGVFHHTSTWISHGCGCTFVPPSWTPLSPPSPPQTLGCPRAPALSALLHALNLHWWSILHMVIYMFQCYSLKLSHPHLLPHSPKVCSLHLCLFCSLAYRVIVTVFLNSIYMH